MRAGTNGTKARRVEARLAAFRLVSEVQSRNDAAVDLATARREAEVEGWAEVERLLLYVEVVRACWLSEAEADRRIDELLERSERDGDDPLRAAGLALRAEWRYREGNSEADAARSDAGLALATALPDMPHGPALERVSALISCACAYAERGLWELEEETYSKAVALLPLCEDPMPAKTVLHNRPFAHLYAACSLHEIGEVEQALEHCRQGVALVASALATGLPDDFAASVRAVRYLLAAIAGDRRPEPLDVILADTARCSTSTRSAPCASQRRCGRCGRVTRRPPECTLGSPSRCCASIRSHPSWPWRCSWPRRRPLPSMRTDPPPRCATANTTRSCDGRRGCGCWDRQGLGWRPNGCAWSATPTRGTLWWTNSPESATATTTTVGLPSYGPNPRWGRLAVLVVDIDRFKTVNDTHGHAAGDEVLRRVGRLLRAASRPADLVARLGGDEFVLLLGAVGAVTAHNRALGLLDAVRAEAWHEVSPGTRVSVSIGLATGPTHDAEQLLRLADTALYQAKTAGRDGVVMIEPTLALANP